MRVEAIVWHDAYKADREAINTGPMILVSVGFLIHEDRQLVIIGHEAENNGAWRSKDSDFIQIPTRMIKKRVVLGEVTLPIELKPVRKRARRVGGVASLPPALVVSGGSVKGE